MNRFLLLSVLFLFAAGTASADYVLMKINMNQLSFSVPGPPQGKGPPMPPPGKLPFDPKGPPPPAPLPPEDPNPKWISSYVEVRNRAQKATVVHPWFTILTYDHNWGKSNLMVLSKMFPIYGGEYIHHDSFNKEFSAKFSKEKAEKDKNVTGFLQIARWALSRGHVKEFHEVMTEAEKADPKNDNVKQYLRIRKGLQRPFKDEDPALRDTPSAAGLITALRKKEYKPFDSNGGHYRIYALVPDKDRHIKTVIERRLALMEDTLETFYYWFALREEPELLKRPLSLPRYRLNAIVTVSKEEFQLKYAAWGQPPLAGDGFTPRRENVMVLSLKSRLNDPLYQEYESLLATKIQEGNQKVQQINVTLTREDLLNGNLSNAKLNPAVAKNPMINVGVGVAQGAVLLAKTLENDAERQTVTHESIRQLLTAAEVFPRNVQIPDWTVEGLAAFFETPRGAVYPTIGSTSWTHLISFKYFDKTKRFSAPADVLQNVVTDAYFIDARQLSKEAQGRPDSAEIQKSARDAWELARCSSWALVYYLSEKKKLHYLFNYGDELDKLPRDLDLNESVLQATFGKTFNMSDPRDARQLDKSKMENEASRWFAMMRTANMDGANREILKIQANYEEKRARQDGKGAPPSNPDAPPTPDTNAAPLLSRPPPAGSEPRAQRTRGESRGE